ncbi:MAG: T9SS type A sorting domain-containing protein [Bacteroidales bacterium]|nr:T9SS type A sorting domain-containing protein [Bacteroidales bacterium]
MKKIVLLFVFSVLSALLLNAQYLRGDFNAWSSDDLMQQYYSHYGVTIEVASEIVDAGFKVDQDGDWVLQWGYATDSYNPIVNTSEGQMRGSNSGDTPGNFTKTFSAGKFYTFRIEGEDTWWNRRFVIMETDAAPVELVSVSDNSVVQNENEVTVTVTTSAELSAQETVYIRYTTDNWVTNNLVACSGSETTYTGIIPAQVAPTTVEYYVLSSAMVLSFVTDNPDFATLNGNNNSGTNYSYTVTSASPYVVAGVAEDLVENNLDNAEIDIELFNETLDDNMIDPSNIILNNAPIGLSVLSANYVDDNNFTLVLDFDGTDFVSDIADFSITILADELSGSDPLTSNNLIVYAFVQTEDFYLAEIGFWEGGAEDIFYNDEDFDAYDFGTLNASSSLYLKFGKANVWKITGGDITSAKMYYRYYMDGDTPGAFSEQILEWESETVSNDTTYQVWWNDTPDEIDLNLLELVASGTYYIEVYFEVENGESEIITRNNEGSNYIAQFTYEEVASFTATPSDVLNSSSLDAMSISLSLDNETFVDDVLDESNFTLQNTPTGLSVLSVAYNSTTEATLTLEYSGGNILTQIDNFTITIDAAEITGVDNLTSNNMIIFADVIHEDIYMCKVSMWEGSGSDTWYDEVDFDGHDFGSFNSSMSLYFKTGQVFTWQDSEGDIVSAAMNYRIYKDGETPGTFVNVDLPYYSEWVSGTNLDKLWWNDSPDEIDINLLEGIEEGTYHFEVYYEAETGDAITLYSNNNGDNYIATFTFTSNPILVATPAESMHEENLDGMEITLSVTEDFFADAMLDQANFTLNNAPLGLTIDEVIYVGPVEATVVLAFDGTNFDVDISDFSISVAASEFDAGIALTSNNMTITAIDESVTIFTHLLTTTSYNRYLGDDPSFWINMEIGQPEWDGAQIGFGEVVDDPTDWQWFNAEWYEDGEDQNKRVHSLITVENEVGTVYYAGRVRNTAGGTWYYANNSDWSESSALNAEYTIETMALPPVQTISANELDGTRINLEWTPETPFNNVMIIAKSEDAIVQEPAQGATYSVGEVIDGAQIIYKGNAGSFIHTGLQNNTIYNYKIYTINNNYYSAAIDANATTNDQQGCTFTIDLGEDVNVCGGSSILINSDLVLAPFGDSLTIYFDASGFVDFVGLDKVYMHAGVSLQGGTPWDYVVGNWGEDDGLGLMSEISEDLWSFKINPVNYFGFNADADLLGINLVFRNSDGSAIAQHPISGEDFYIDMTINPPFAGNYPVSVDYIESPITSILWSNGAETSSISVSTANEYSIIAADRFGCVGMDTINVELHSIPYVELGEDQTVCIDNEIVLDAGEFESYLWSDDSEQQNLTVAESGMYGVTVTDINGCTGFDIVNINLVDYPIAEFSYEFLNDMEVYFSDSSENAVSYSWDFNGDNNEDSNVAGDVSYIYQNIGQFAASLTVTNQCSSDNYSQIIYVLSIDDADFNNLSVYPNPVSEILNVEVSEWQNSVIKLFTIDGKMVFEDIINDSNIHQFDVSNVSPGLYNLTIESENNYKTIKLIIK